MAGDLTAAGPELHVTPVEQLSARAAARIEAVLADAIADRGSAALALAGGNTPRPVYEQLADLPGIRWDRLQVYFGDERAVPPDDPASNYRMARETLLDRVPVDSVHVHRMLGEAADLDAAARDYDALLPPALDLVLLGIGEDGHTASLFPAHAAVRERARRVVPVAGPKPPHHRLTVTPPVLEAARTCLVIAAGSAKATAVARALVGSEPTERCPARLARNGIWFVDTAAAAALPS